MVIVLLLLVRLDTEEKQLSLSYKVEVESTEQVSVVSVVSLVVVVVDVVSFLRPSVSMGRFIRIASQQYLFIGIVLTIMVNCEEG